jgi:hypothetical protein
MKTKSTVLISLALALVVSTTLIAPAFAKVNLNPNKLYGAPNYVLNMLGKKEDWSGGGEYNNPDRHTMMVPSTTTGIGGTGYRADGSPIQVNLTMWITQGDEFAVIDGNGFDDDDVALQLAPGKYAVFVVALGKPGGNADIRGWVYNATDNTYLFMTGMVNVPGHSKKPVWKEATDLLFVSSQEDPYGIVTGENQWIFDYLAALESAMPLGDYLYLWDFANTNIQHLQLRFYQIA